MIFTLEHLRHLLESNQYDHRCKQCIIELGPFEKPRCPKCLSYDAYTFWGLTECDHAKDFVSDLASRLHNKKLTNYPEWILLISKLLRDRR